MTSLAIAYRNPNVLEFRTPDPRVTEWTTDARALVRLVASMHYPQPNEDCEDFPGDWAFTVTRGGEPSAGTHRRWYEERNNYVGEAGYLLQRARRLVPARGGLYCTVVMIHDEELTPDLPLLAEKECREWCGTIRACRRFLGWDELAGWPWGDEGRAA